VCARLATSFAVIAILAVAARASAAAPRRVQCVVRLDVATILTAATSEYIADGAAVAEARGCALLVVLDTPGGELEATREVVQQFFASDAPVIVYVSPDGARAGSAGVFVTLAAHVAAMAPGTAIGAAHPVVGLGQDPEKAGGEHLARKVENDTAALARAIAQRRGRNADWAEEAVRESVSATSREALEERVIDAIAPSERALLAMLDGREVETATGPAVLATRDAPVHDHAMSIGQKVRSVVGNPSLVYLLFMIGVLGLVIELTSPGLIVPGAIGGLSLLLAAVGINALPVQVGAIILMVIGAAALAAEMFVGGYGLLALLGVAALGLGGAFLIDHDTAEFFADPSIDVSWTLIAPLALVVGAVAIAVAVRVRQVQVQHQVTGREAMRGCVGRAETALGEHPGHILVEGERWLATSSVPIAPGQQVRIDEIHGLTVHVSPVEPQDVGGMR